MTLINDFFVVLDSKNIDTGFITTIELNASHIIYSSHFPGHPVTPGVIQMQLVHELLEKHFGIELRLITMAQCKFLKILNPVESPRIVIHIELKQTDELLNIKAMGKKDPDIFFKIESSYQFIQNNSPYYDCSAVSNVDQIAECITANNSEILLALVAVYKISAWWDRNPKN